MKIGIVAGEASGDALGASLIRALRELNPHCEFVGVGGKSMIEQGFKTLYDMEKLSLMGLIEPLFHLPELIKIRRGLLHYFTQNKPDIFIGIDSPDFNLGLELNLRKQGIKTIHYVSPSVWAWRQKRVFKIAKAVDLILTLFPFEKSFYEKFNVPVQFVGHPLADKIALQPDKNAARIKLNLMQDATYIALLPGSRGNELKHLGKVFIETALRLWQKNPALQFITAAVNTQRAEEFKQFQKEIAPQLPLTFFASCSHDVMTAADLVLVTSGTATLETMLHKRPMVIAYRTSFITHQLAKLLVKIKFFGLPNLLADESLVPEFFQDAATPENLSNAILEFLNHPEKVLQLQKRFLEMHETLRLDASRRAAESIFSIVKV